MPRTVKLLTKLLSQHTRSSNHLCVKRHTVFFCSSVFGAVEMKQLRQIFWCLRDDEKHWNKTCYICVIFKMKPCCTSPKPKLTGTSSLLLIWALCGSLLFSKPLEPPEEEQHDTQISEKHCLWDPAPLSAGWGPSLKNFPRSLTRKTKGKKKTVERAGHSPEDYSPSVTWISSSPTFDSC